MYIAYNKQITCCYEDTDLKPCEITAMDCMNCEYCEQSGEYDE